MPVRFPKKVLPWPVLAVQEFVIQEATRTGETSEEIQEWLTYEADKRGVAVEEIVKEEVDAWQWLKDHPLTKEQLEHLVSNPDPRYFETEENPFE